MLVGSKIPQRIHCLLGLVILGPEKRVSKMVICSDPDESDAKWEATLRKALADVETNADMPADGKAKIMADLKSEIARVSK